MERSRTNRMFASGGRLWNRSLVFNFSFADQHHRDVVANRIYPAALTALQSLTALSQLYRSFAQRANQYFEKFGVYGHSVEDGSISPNMRITVVILLMCWITAPAAAQSRRSVWEGVYSESQAARGKIEYERACAKCHGPNLDGIQDANLLGDFSPRVSIRGTDFMERWREMTLQSLYSFALGMPPKMAAAIHDVRPSTREAYIDILAFILKGNSFPPGNRDLDESDLRRIRIQQKDGAKPLPSFSRVQVVGCLTQFKPGLWQLGQAGEPLRIRDINALSQEELDLAASDPLSNNEFDLQNIGYIGGAFSPTDNEHKKIVVRGVMIRQPPMVRIDVKVLSVVAESCQ